jgi:hypothetical protein
MPKMIKQWLIFKFSSASMVNAPAVEAFQDKAAGRKGEADIPGASEQDDYGRCDSNKAVE